MHSFDAIRYQELLWVPYDERSTGAHADISPLKHGLWAIVFAASIQLKDITGLPLKSLALANQ